MSVRSASACGTTRKVSWCPIWSASCSPPDGGARFGGPKALARTSAGVPWLHRAVAVLEDAGCEAVLVVLGAEAEEAAALVPAGATTVVADRWRGRHGRVPRRTASPRCPRRTPPW